MVVQPAAKVVKPAAKIDHEVDPKQKEVILGLYPNPQRLLENSATLDTSILEELSYSSVLSARLFGKSLFCELCKLAAILQLKKFPIRDVLYDKIMAAAFFEPSTRTRLSFESAMLHLGGKTLSVTEAATTSIAKGESLLDIGQMFNSYADIVVVRHTEQKALQELSHYLRIPLINGGNGSDEHPTQALADWYAILKWKPEIAFSNLEDSKKIQLGIIGTPGNMRSVKSFLILSLLFAENIKEITIVSEMADPLGEDVQDFCDKSTIPVHLSNDLQQVVSKLDVLYMNAIAYLGDSYRHLGSQFKLSSKSGLKKESVILHPLARRDELSMDLDNTEHNLYFNQADGAVFVRQALLLSIFDRVKNISI